MIPNIRTMFILGTLTVIILSLLLVKVAKADSYFYACFQDDSRVTYSYEYPVNCPKTIAHRVVATYTQADIKRWAKQQRAYELNQYRQSVRNTARFLDDVSRQRRANK